jgi:DNA-binding helix-hairpin-helix protein with protein kinase domain
LAIVAVLLALKAYGLEEGVRWLIGIVGVAAGALLHFRAGGTDEIRPFKEQERVATERYKDLERRWSQEAGNRRFHNKRRELEGVRLELGRLPHYRDERLRNLEANRRETQLRAFLEQFEIADAVLDGIGASRKASLLSYGIETAEDVTNVALSRVPGFGPVLISKLLQWRTALEGRFRFDPAKGIDQKDVEAVMREM